MRVVEGTPYCNALGFVHGILLRQIPAFVQHWSSGKREALYKPLWLSPRQSDPFSNTRKRPRARQGPIQPDELGLSFFLLILTHTPQ